jgi:uncharacterized protein (DUF488 family)
MPQSSASSIYTVGHSRRTFEEFTGILRFYEIAAVVDVRTIPASRHNPQYNQDELSRGLRRRGIDYIHLKGLGGLRHTTKASINRAWRNASFRGFADYMQTPEFQENLERLIDIVREKRTVLLCAEALPWRCHRSLIGDALLNRNVEVIDILSEKVSKPHTLTPFAKIEGDTITYPEVL